MKQNRGRILYPIFGNVQYKFSKKDVNDYEWLDEATCNNIFFLFLCGSLKKKRHCLKNIICFQRYYRLNPHLHDSLSALLDVSTSRRLFHDLQSYARQSNFNSILLILSANDTARNNLSRILNRKFSIFTQVSWNGVMYLDLQSLNKYRY